jgi:tetratricopeptide (TPR) repeat protein
VADAAKVPVKREVVRSSLKFADTYPEHEKAAMILGAAADDLYDMQDYEPAVAAARKLIEVFPGAEVGILRAAWLVVGHSTYELLRYNEAEIAYVNVLALLPAGDKTREALTDNLAAAIYKQGEQANALEDYRAAADHFLRVGRMAPTSKIRITAEYDAAVALMQLKDWKQAATVLVGFRDLFPGHALQPEVTKKIAFVYREDGLFSLAADEYERVERESRDDEVRRGALLIAAELHDKAGNKDRTLVVYRRYVGYFPQPVELNLEIRDKIADLLKEKDDQKGYMKELGEIVALDAAAGRARTPRTRFLGGKAALVLTEPKYASFVEVRLVKPFEVNLRKKRELMKAATQAFTKLLDYEIGEVTAAATFYLAEIYAHFCKALLESERPDGLSPLEMEQYELAIEEQAYPFEDKAIEVHEKNLELLTVGIYNVWIDKSLEKLAGFVPARYARPEEQSAILASLSVFTYEIERPVIAPPEPEVQATDLTETEAGENAEDLPDAVVRPETAPQ